MEVQLTLHGILRDYLPPKTQGKKTLNLPLATSVAEVIEQLKIRQKITAAINGVRVETSQALQDGDELHLFRMIGGG